MLINTQLADFLELLNLDYFNLTDLLSVTSNTSVIEVLVLMFIAFISMIFCIVGFRIILEIVKLLLDFKRWV